jgi:hypothetical protein
MSQPTAPTLPPGAIPPIPLAPGASQLAGPPAPSQAPTRAKTARLSTTPGKMRLVLAISVIAGVLFGLAGLQAGSLQASAAASANEQADQLVGVQDIRNNLVRADAIAANAFLVGGLEPADQRAQYDTAIQRATQLIATLSAGNPQDAQLLSKVSSDVASYTGLIEQARANNRQGFPVGSAYLDQASTQLRDDALPTLASVVQNNAQRVSDSFAAAQNALWYLIVCAIAFLALVVCHIWLTRRTHRYLNRPLFTGIVVVVVVGIIGGVVFGSSAATASRVRTNSYAATLAVSQAFTSATDAKSTESFTLIKRGSGATLEKQFQASLDDAKKRIANAHNQGIIADELGTKLDTWSHAHDGIRTLDDGGKWDDAVALAISTDPGSPNAAFDAFSSAADHQISVSAKATSDQLVAASVFSQIAAWLLLVAGLGAAVLAWRGVSLRLKEYQ